MKKLFFVVPCPNHTPSKPAGYFLHARYIFAHAAPKGHGSAENADDITLDNLRENIDRLEDSGAFKNASTVTRAIEICNLGTAEEKSELLKQLKKFITGNIPEQDFVRRINMRRKDEAGKPSESGESEVKEPGAEKLEPADPKEDIKKITSTLSKRIKSVLSSVQQIQSGLEAKPSDSGKETLQRFRQLGKDLETLAEIDAQNTVELEKTINSLVEQKKLTRKDAQILMDLDVENPLFDKKFEEHTKKMSGEEDRDSRDALMKKIRSVAESTQKIEEDYRKRAQELVKLMEDMSDEVLQKMEEEQARQMLSTKAGFPVEPGKVIVFFDKKADGTEIMREVRVKSVDFPDIEIKDEEDNTVKKIKSPTPTVTLEWDAYEDQPPGEYAYTESAFLKNVDLQGMHEKVEGLNEENLPPENRGKGLSLESLIGEKIRLGDTFEFREKVAGENLNPIGVDKNVKVVSIDDSKKQLTLDTEVATSQSPYLKKSKTLSFAEFAKWYRRNETVRPIGSMEVLRKKLLDLQNERNATINDPQTGKLRSVSAFPPIHAIPGEELKYDTLENPRKFRIADVDDKKITMSDGATFTPASFLRWVKNNFVEKVTEENTNKSDIDVKLSEPPDENAPANDNADKNKSANDNAEPNDDHVYQPAEDVHFEEFKANASKGTFADIWKRTHVLTIHDIKEVWERFKKFIVGKKIRKIKERQLNLGKMIAPASQLIFDKFNIKEGAWQEFQADFDNDIQRLGIEKTSKVKEMIKEYGVYDIKSIMYQSFSKDWLRACIETLAGMGEVRWDDKEMWDSLIKQCKGDKDKIKTEDDLRSMIDKEWGAGTYHSWKTRNGSAYNSNVSTYSGMAPMLMSKPGGIKASLQKLLYKHLQGEEYVNAAEYEGYLSWAIEFNTLDIEDEVYFVLMGVGARGKKPKIEFSKREQGDALLPPERFASMAGKFMNTFPVLQYWTRGIENRSDKGEFLPDLDEKGNPIFVIKDGKKMAAVKKGKNWTTGNFTYDVVRKYMYPELINDKNKKLEDVVKSPDQIGPNSEFREFLKGEVYWDPIFLGRLMDKASSNMRNFDHDHMDVFGPHMSEENVSMMTTKQGGGEAKVSTAGLKNVCVGFNEYLHKSFEYLNADVSANNESAAREKVDRITGLLRSFVRFDAIISNRFEPVNQSRLGDMELNGNAGADPSRKVKEHIKEIHTFLGELCTRLGIGNQWGAVLVKEQPNKAVKGFGGILQDTINMYVKEHGVNAFNDMIKDIQSGNGAKNIEIKGQLGQRKKTVGEEERGPVSESIVERPDLKNKLTQLRELQAGKVKTREQMEEEQNLKIQETIRFIEEGRYARISPEDEKMLENYIHHLEQQARDGKVVSIDKSKQAKSKKYNNTGAPKYKKAA